MIKVFKGLSFDKKGLKMIAKGVISAAAIYGASITGLSNGAYIGTMICPGVGTAIGGAIGSMTYSLLM